MVWPVQPEQYPKGCSSVILLRPKIGVEPPKHDVISMPTQQYTNTNHILLERSHLVVSVMLRYMDRIKTFNDHLSCREVKIDKKFWGDLLYFALKCDKFLYARLQTGRIMVWWCPSVRPSAHFLHFSHTCFDIMSWNFAHDFVLMYYRSSLSVITLRQFLYARRDVLWYGDVRPSVRPGLRPPVFRTFLLHALTYWAEILHMTLF